ncbi:MAG: YeeE/YedE thiosulfate transporter family protein [Gemmatimonadaceae bacterium]
MMAPFYEYGAFSDRASLIVAIVIGTAFGFTLERAGLGNARKLAAQFYLRDLTVLKVMFSAVVTAMLGVFWLTRFGLLDLSQVYVPETYLAPQLIGGLIFGAGFVIGGLCPGTSCVAAATGRRDGWMAVVGMFVGVFTVGLLFRWLQPFYESTARGNVTLPAQLGIPYGFVVCAITAMALAMFAAAERIERRPSSPMLPE